MRARIVAAVVAVVLAGTGIGVYLATRSTFVSVTSYSDAIPGAVVSADGRTVSASVGPIWNGPQGPSTQDLAVTITADTVVLRIRMRTIEHAGPLQSSPGIPNPHLTAALPVPLGGRSLVDGTGRKIPYIDGRTLLAPPPGSGWRIDYTPVTNPTGGAFVGAMEDFTSADPNSCKFELTQRTPSANIVPNGPATEVRGATANLGLGGGELWWSEHGQQFSLRAYWSDSVPMPTNQQLVDFANSLRAQTATP